MKILIVKYLPSGQSSNTLRLANHFKQSIGSKHDVTELDLIQTPPKFFDEHAMLAYKKRNYGGETLDASLSAAIKPMDSMMEQFMNADVVVLATPMHNFSLPGLVKLYFDSIMQNGKAFKYENDQQIGLMKNTKFLTLYTSMGVYKGEYGFMDNLKTIMKIELDFMGIQQYEFIQASTGNETTKNIHIENSQKSIDAVVKKWLL